MNNLEQTSLTLITSLHLKNIFDISTRSRFLLILTQTTNYIPLI